METSFFHIPATVIFLTKRSKEDENAKNLNLERRAQRRHALEEVRTQIWACFCFRRKTIMKRL